MITVKEALHKVNQEQTFAKVFGELPSLDRTYISPFRKNDTNPGCYFEWHKDVLYFVDWASNIVNKDCIQAIMSKYNMRLTDAIDFVMSDIEHIPKKTKTETSTKSSSKTIIIPIKRDFSVSDKLYWKRYGISIRNLTEDCVFPVKAVNLYSKSSWKRINYMSDSYCITVTSERFKIYRPHETGKSKWLSNVSKNSIGSMNNLSHISNTVIITKSYKDCRVIRNLGYECVWFQSEGILPDNRILFSVFQNYRRVIVLFDNDDAGVIGAMNLVEYLNHIFQDKVITSIVSSQSHIKDVSEMYCFKGEEYTKQFLYENTSDNI